MNKEVFSSLLHSYLDLVALYLNKQEAKDLIIDDEKASFYLRLSEHHSLKALFFKVLEATKASISSSYLKQFEEAYYLNVRKHALFKKERKDLYQFLNDNDIDFLPLKGIILQDYYLDNVSREFADNDILFKDKDNLIKDFFIKRGYEVEYFKKSNHDVYIKKPCYNFEMHRALFGETGDNEKVVNYFKDYINTSLIKENKEHYLSNEDFYIYFTAHTYKHFHVSGCGIRTLIDYYLYLKNNDLDFNYINEELKKIDLEDFSNKISSLSIKLFDKQPLNEDEENMLLFIASSGTYGTLVHAVSKGIKEKGKFRYFLSRIFPPYSFYKSAYPWAYKSVVLIPVAWLFRLFRIIFRSPKRAMNEIKTINQSKEKKEKK